VEGCTAPAFRESDDGTLRAVAYTVPFGIGTPQKVTQVTHISGLSWFALNTKFRYEDYVGKQLSAKGYEILLPVYRCRRRWSDRMKNLELPLFPGYLFCRFDANDRLPILMTPGMIQVVGFGKTPVPVEDSEIVALQRTLSSDLRREPWPYLQIGEKVRVECGALQGVEGILLSVKGGHRLVLSITLLQRSVAVELNSAWVAPIAQPRSSSKGPAAISAA
jgi:transcription antitermination factor NusG